MTPTCRTRIKICGITRAQDIDAAVRAGVDAVGLVFYPPSRRFVSLDQALALRRRVPAFVTVTALFVNPRPDQVEQVLADVRPDVLQFHGEETPEFCTAFGWRYLKAFRVGAPGQDTASALARRCRLYPDAAGWLFDSYSPGFGGSGRHFDAALLGGTVGAPDARACILSGGLTAETVGGFIEAWSPFGVDVSSGVESAPGLKDARRIAEFVQAVRRADGRPATTGTDAR